MIRVLACLVLGVLLTCAPAIAADDPVLPETLRLRAEVLQLKGRVRQLENTLKDRDARLQLFELLIRDQLNLQTADLEADWRAIEAEAHAILKPKPDERFDRQTLTFSKPKDKP